MPDAIKADEILPRKKLIKPPREIEKRIFENLCKIHCTKTEVEHVLETDSAVIEKWCIRTYDKTYDEMMERFKSEGKMSLRRAQFKSALEGSIPMQIWLGKVLLGQRDITEDQSRLNQALGVLATIQTIKITDDNSHTIKETGNKLTRSNS